MVGGLRPDEESMQEHVELRWRQRGELGQCWVQDFVEALPLDHEINAWPRWGTHSQLEPVGSAIGSTASRIIRFTDSRVESAGGIGGVARSH
jgi:hypothetical protein